MSEYCVVARRRPLPAPCATSSSIAGSSAPIGERPALIAPTFHPELVEGRCTTVTRVGTPSGAQSSAEASSAAIGSPTMPGPTTAISRTKTGSGTP